MKQEEQKQTPFAYHTDSFIRYDTVKPSKGIQSVRNLFERRLLKEPEAAVLNAINTYEYLNAFLVRKLVSQQMEFTQSFCKEILAKLVKCGLLSRFRVIYSDTYKKEHASSYIYSFAERGRKLFGKQGQAEQEIRVRDILATLAFNQFFIMTKQTYREALTNVVYCYSDGNTEYDGRIQFNSHGRIIRMDVITIRQEEQWKEAFLKRLRKQRHIKEPKSSAVLVLCETELQALDAERTRKSAQELKNLELCYLCDYASFSGKPTLEQLLRVNPESDYSTYDVCSLPIDGVIRVTDEVPKEECDE